jgi:hypothetical protein
MDRAKSARKKLLRLLDSKSPEKAFRDNLKIDLKTVDTADVASVLAFADALKTEYVLSFSTSPSPILTMIGAVTRMSHTLSVTPVKLEVSSAIHFMKYIILILNSSE